jgi:hypothetical protein
LQQNDPVTPGGMGAPGQQQAFLGINRSHILFSNKNKKTSYF